MSEPLLETRMLCKNFGALAASRDINFRLAAGGQSANPLPILAGSLVVALQAADVAALQQRRRRIRCLGDCLLDIGERGVEPGTNASLLIFGVADVGKAAAILDQIATTARGS